MERAFDLSLSGRIEEFYLHVRDHHSGRCECGELLDEAEVLSFRLSQAQSDVKNTISMLQGE